MPAAVNAALAKTMKTYLIRRFASMLLGLLGVSIVIFVLVRLVPGDVIDVLYGTESQVSPEVRQQRREEFGLDQPLPVQYLKWLSHVVRGDLGESIRSGRPVTTELLDRLPVTLELTLLSLLAATLLAVPLALISVLKRDTLADLAVRLLGLTGLSLPNFWIATLLLLCCSLWLGWGPPVSWVSFFHDPRQNLLQMLLPVISLSMILMAAIMRMMRATLLEVLHEPYVTTARAKGLAGGTVLRRHALINTLIPVITTLGLQMGYLLGGAVVIEQIFSLPGLGSLTLFAVTNRDYPLLQGSVLLFALLFMATNLIVDLLYGAIDPRIRLG
jgi:peptide/nickel transport system permease protein